MTTIHKESLKCTVVVFKVSPSNRALIDSSDGFFLVQERLTRQIAEAIQEAVEPRGVAVIVECV
jgi:hypothetical protein